MREHDNGGLGIAGANPLDQFQPPDLRDFQIRDDNVNWVLVQDFESLLRGCGRVDMKPCFQRDIITQVPRGDFVINYQEIKRPGSCRYDFCPCVRLHDGDLFSKQSNDRAKSGGNHKVL